MAAKRKAKSSNPVVEEAAVTSIKGFDANLRCSGFQFETGKTFVHEGRVAACKEGFHACPVEQHPLSVFDFYPPAGSRYFEVQQGGETNTEGVKLASATLTLSFELTLGDLVKRAWDYVWSRATLEGEKATGYQGAASATGYQGAASATGEYGAASATGSQGAASATGEYGAASATGEYGAASATGYQGAASATGEYGAASATGTGGKAKGIDGCALFLVERLNDFDPEHGKIIAVWAGIAGRDGIKADTFYTLRDGEPVEVGA